ncbi:uncharacterized protein B0H18DRAFT_1211770 [Fomitopsis serialis]|uniref:uncharacterized protein n=1 Tax=Fomitopsis serialis TaxID=139415 RepID=UPI0020072DA0|nr:uncharacterized protein B0H18DRAFT_1211770 [Neoantrodia serialis]KAH9924499.1 hypothetical protein B0H18DRAFT_1211770 [Neoantrodia serialis]
MSGSTTNPSEATRSNRGTRSGTRSKLKALRAEIKSKLAASQERLEHTLAEAAASQQRINAALEESKQTRKDLMDAVDEALSAASSSSSGRSSRAQTARTESSDQENSAGAPTEQAPSDREVEHALGTEQPEPTVGSAQSHPETLSRAAPAQAAKPGTLPKDGARAEFDDRPGAELEPELSERCVESTHLQVREGIGTQYYSSSTMYSGSEPTPLDTLVARSEMSRDTKNILPLSNDVRATTSSRLDATRDALNATSVERHESVASAPRASAYRTTLDRHHRPAVLDHLHSLGSHLERPSGEPDARAVPTRVRTRVCDWLADLPPVQSVATDLVPPGTRSPLPPSPALHLSPLASRLDLGGPLLESDNSGDRYRGSGDTQPSHATQDLNDARSSPTPSSETERTMDNADRGERKKDRGQRSSEDEEGTQGQREEGCWASRKHEPEGSTTTGTYSLYVPASQPPLPVPVLAGVATNKKLVVRTASHEDGNYVPRHDCEVVPDVPGGSTPKVLRDDLQVVPSMPPVSAPVGVSTNVRLVVRTTGHEYGTSAHRYNCEVVPDVPRELRYDPEVVPGPSTLQGNTTDAQYCTSDVPHNFSTGYRVADTPQTDVSASISPSLTVPAQAIVATNVKFAARIASDGEGTIAPRGDPRIVPPTLQDGAPVLEDDREVVLFISQGGTTDQQRCRSDVPHSTSTGCDAVFADSSSASRIAHSTAPQDTLHILTEVQASDCFSTAEPHLVQLAEPLDDPDDLSRNALDPARVMASDPQRMTSPREACTALTDVQTQLLRVCAAEPSTVQLADSPDDPTYDRQSSCHDVDADGCRTVTHATQDARIAPTAVRQSDRPCAAEPHAVQLLDLGTVSSHQSLCDPSAPANAQSDACVFTMNALARDRDSTAALLPVQQPALTDPDRPERHPDRQPDENFTVLVEGSLLGTPTQLPIDSFAAPDIGGDYERHHESEVARALRRSSAGRMADQAGDEGDVDESAETEESDEEGLAEGGGEEGCGVGEGDEPASSKDRGTSMSEVPPPPLPPPPTPPPPPVTTTTTNAVIVAATTHVDGMIDPWGDLQVEPSTDRPCGTIGGRVRSTGVPKVPATHTQTSDSSFDACFEEPDSDSKSEYLTVVAIDTGPSTPRSDIAIASAGTHGGAPGVHTGTTGASHLSDTGVVPTSSIKLEVGADEHPHEQCEYHKVLKSLPASSAVGAAQGHDISPVKGKYLTVLASSPTIVAVSPPCHTATDLDEDTGELNPANRGQSAGTSTNVDVRRTAPGPEWRPSGRYVLPARRVQQDRRDLDVYFDGEHQPKYCEVLVASSERDRELPPSTSKMDVLLSSLDPAQSNGSTRTGGSTSVAPGSGTPGENEPSFLRMQMPSASTRATTRVSPRAQTEMRSRDPLKGFQIYLEGLKAQSMRRPEPLDSGERRRSSTTDGTKTEPARAQGGATSSTRGVTLLRGEGSGASSSHRLIHTMTSTPREDVLVPDPLVTRMSSRELDLRITHGNSTRRSGSRTVSQGFDVQDTVRVASTSHSDVLELDVVTGRTSNVDVRASRRTLRQVPPVLHASSDRIEVQDTRDRRSRDITSETSTSRHEVLGLNRVPTALGHPVTVDVSRWPTDKVSREECFTLLADQLEHDFDEADVAASTGEWDIWAHCKRSALSCGQAIEDMSPRPGTYSRAACRAWDHFQRELEVVPLEFDPRLVAPLPMEMVRHWAYNKLGWLVVPPRQQPVDESDWYNSSDEEPRTMTREEYPDHVESEYPSESEHLSSWDSRRSGSEETNSVVVSDYYEQSEMEDTLSSSALSADDEGNSEDADYYSESE